jgi:DNA-binding transcriptional ArsR family regulator
MAFRPDVEVIKFLKALDNEIRLKIVELIINSSPASFSTINEYLDRQTGKEINKGTLAYHLDILVQANVLHKKLERRPDDREYSQYDITEYAEEKLESLGLLIRGD